jgi:5-methyltetrahydropteroyltriglutamate--homocysteine methyltransferase
MSDVKSFIHGVYPRSTELIQTSRGFDRNRQSAADLQERQQIDLKNLLELETAEGLDLFEDGKLTWQDIFRPFVEASDGMEVGALTRWFDNNTFFRQPIITGKVQLDEKKLASYFPILDSRIRGNDKEKGKWKVTLPSPFLFAKLADDTKSATFEKTLEQITQLLSETLAYLDKKGIAFVQLNEPYIPYHQTSRKEIKLFMQSLAQLKKAKGEMQLAVHSYFGDSAPLVSALAESETVDGIGIDFFKTSLSSLPTKLPYAIIAGVVDGRNSLLEDTEVLKKFTKKALRHFEPEVLYLTNNSDLDLLPETVAREKVALLGEVSLSLQK